MDFIQILNRIQECGVESLKVEERQYLMDLFNNQNDIHVFLSSIKYEDIETKRERFRMLDNKGCSEDELFKAVMDIVSFDYNGISMGVLFPCIGTYKKGTRLYRIRKLEGNDYTIPLKILSREQDVWDAPPECVKKLGRLNGIGESLLYTSPLSKDVAVEEMRIKDNEWFVLIAYQAKRDFNVAQIGRWINQKDLSDDENLKMRMIHNILSDIFSKEVGEGTEYLYRASARIAKDYFDYPSDKQDAWCYPSVVSKKGCNVCFRPEKAREILKFVGAPICTVERLNGNYIYNCTTIAFWNEKNQSFDYYPIDSPQCRLLFPEMKS